MKWSEAVRKWNESRGWHPTIKSQVKWITPKRGSTEYDEVKKLMKGVMEAAESVAAVPPPPLIPQPMMLSGTVSSLPATLATEIRLPPVVRLSQQSLHAKDQGNNRDWANRLLMNVIDTDTEENEGKFIINGEKMVDELTRKLQMAKLTESQKDYITRLRIWIANHMNLPYRDSKKRIGVDYDLITAFMDDN